MRVAFEATALLGPRTGVGEFCFNAVCELNRLPEVQLSAFAVSWRRRNLLAAALGNNVAMRQLAMPARPLHAMWRRYNFPPVELFVGYADVVHGSNFVVPPSLRAKRVVTVHDLTPVLFPMVADPSTLIFPSLIQRAIGDGAYVHVPSNFVAAQVIEYFGADPSRVFTVYHGVSSNASQGFKPNDALLDPVILEELSGAPFVLGLGTIEPRKDFVSLVRAFELVASTYQDLRLVIAGQPGWGASVLADVISSSKYSRRIFCPGYVSSSARNWLLSNAEVFVYPSIYEGFGLPPIEAISRGTAVISSNAGSLPEVLGPAADFFNAGDVSSLSESISILLSDSARREALISRAHSWIERYSWEACARGLAEIYTLAISEG